MANAQIGVANSVNGITGGSASSGGTADSSGLLFTSSSFDMSGGNAVALLLTTETDSGGAGFSSVMSATFAGQSMNSITINQGAQQSAIFYLINPSLTSGTFDVTVDPSLSVFSYAYSQISLSNVGGLAGTDSIASTSTSTTTPLGLNYTTTTPGGFVLGSAVNNDYNGARALSVTGNPNTSLYGFVDIPGGSSGHYQVYGSVPAAGSYTDDYLGQYARTAITTVAFDAVPEPGTLALASLAGGFALLLVRRQKRK